MTDDKKLTIRVNKAVWSRACVNSKLKGYGSLQEYIRKCIVELNDWQEEAEKSKVILEARQRG